MDPCVQIMNILMSTFDNMPLKMPIFTVFIAGVIARIWFMACSPLCLRLLILLYTLTLARIQDTRLTHT